MVLGVVVLATAAVAQPAPPDGAVMFRQQCAVCHTLNAGDPPRQGPTLAGVYGRKAGSVPGFTYSPGLSGLDIVWDDAHLDTYLTNEPVASSRVFKVYRGTPPHYHATCDEYLFVLSGRGTFWMGEAANAGIFAPGQLLFFKRGTVHALPEIIDALIGRAKGGDLKAAAYLCDRIMGRTVEAKVAPADDREPPYTEAAFERAQQDWEDDDIGQILAGFGARRGA